MHNKIISFLILTALSFAACQDVIELEVPDGETLLVVDGWLTDQEGEQQVLLSTTANYFNNATTPSVSQALVILYSDHGLVDTLEERSSGVYITNHTGQAGATYHLYIRTADGEEYESWPETLRPVPPISRVYTEYKEESTFFEEGYYVKIDTEDPLGSGDYYRWKQYVNGEYLNTPLDLLYTSDLLVDGNPIEGLEVTTEPLEVGDHVRIQQMSVSKQAFDFFLQLQNQTAFIGSMFDTPPAALQGNMQSLDPGGKRALGFFGVSAVTEGVLVIE
jgi:hypothetical protein